MTNFLSILGWSNLADVLRVSPSWPKLSLETNTILSDPTGFPAPGAAVDEDEDADLGLKAIVRAKVWMLTASAPWRLSHVHMFARLCGLLDIGVGDLLDAYLSALSLSPPRFDASLSISLYVQWIGP